MKKFSNINNIKVGKEPKINDNINEDELFKSKVMDLLNKFLSIKTYGPIDRHFHMSSVKITGKEAFLEALNTLLKEDTLNNEKKILETLKYTIRDWETFDSKIYKIEEKISYNNDIKRLNTHINKLMNIYEKYGDDEELFLIKITESANKLDNDSKKLRAEASLLIVEKNELFKKVADIYNK